MGKNRTGSLEHILVERDDGAIEEIFDQEEINERILSRNVTHFSHGHNTANARTRSDNGVHPKEAHTPPFYNAPQAPSKIQLDSSDMSVFTIVSEDEEPMQAATTPTVQAATTAFVVAASPVIVASFMRAIR